MSEIPVQLRVGPLNIKVLWPSGEGSSLTRRRSVVRVHPGLLDGGNEMNDKNSLTLRLADGKEQTCRDGYEMWVWFMSRRGIHVDSGTEESGNTDNRPVLRRRRPQKQNTKVRVHSGLQSLMQRPPRYANRQSGSA